MDRRSPTDPLTDASLEREIETILDVEPSPDFVARIRKRVADEPVPAAWWLSLRPPVVVAAGALVLLAVAGAWWSQSAPVSHEASVQPKPVAPTVTSPSRGSAPQERAAVVTAGATPHVVRAVNAQRGGGVQLPEVVIAENERQGFAMLLMNIRESGDALPLPSTAALDAPIEPELMDDPTPVVVRRVEVMPVTIAASDQPEGERQ